MRFLGIDYGTKNIGIALSDPEAHFAMPLTTITNSPAAAAEVVKICHDNEVGQVVMGESRDFKGKPNAILEDSLKFKSILEQHGLIVHLELEFLTSASAAAIQGMNEKLDASAAALILQRYLDKQGK